MSEETQIHRGLAGVVVDTTAISTIDWSSNSLRYRGYRVQDLAANVSFEEVAYLLWYGELPTEEQRRIFINQERASRQISPYLADVIAGMPGACHPMDTIRTAVSILGSEDATIDDNPVRNQARAISLMARLPTIIAQDIRRRKGLRPIAPDPDLGFAENFLTMCFGERPDAAVLRCFEISLTLYAEHGFNASTFAARVVTSTLADIYSAVTAAISTLKGPLHGGANEAVMQMMIEIDDPAAAAGWVSAALAEKRKIMGFGHRVYRNGDSRVPTMKDAFFELADAREGQKWKAMYSEIEQAMLNEKVIHPNLDFPTGPAYFLMGFDIPMFTPIFAASRITGWTAHIAEQLAGNALIRPLSSYVGVGPRELPSSRIRFASNPSFG